LGKGNLASILLYHLTCLSGGVKRHPLKICNKLRLLFNLEFNTARLLGSSIEIEYHSFGDK